VITIENTEEKSQENQKHKNDPTKITPEIEDYLLQQLAEGYTQKEVTEKILSEFGVEVSEKTVYNYKRKKEKRILEKRKALNEELDRIAISSKFIRLRYLEQLLEKTEIERGIEKDTKVKLLKGLIKDAKEEMEGIRATIDIDSNPFESVNTNIQELNRQLKELKK
jgi:hypothetical protein